MKEMYTYTISDTKIQSIVFLSSNIMADKIAMKITLFTLYLEK